MNVGAPTPVVTEFAPPAPDAQVAALRVVLRRVTAERDYWRGQYEQTRFRLERIERLHNTIEDLQT